MNYAENPVVQTWTRRTMHVGGIMTTPHVTTIYPIPVPQVTSATFPDPAPLVHLSAIGPIGWLACVSESTTNQTCNLRQLCDLPKRGAGTTIL